MSVKGFLPVIGTWKSHRPLISPDRRIPGTFPDAQLGGPALVVQSLGSGTKEGPSEAHGKEGWLDPERSLRRYCPAQFGKRAGLAGGMVGVWPQEGSTGLWSPLEEWGVYQESSQCTLAL